MDWDALYRNGQYAYIWHPREPDEDVSAITQFIRGKILEVGCGAGAHLSSLVKYGFDASGVDGSPTAVELTKKQGLICEKAEAETLPFADKSFSTVIDFGLLHTIDEATWPSVIKEYRRVLRDGGVLIVRGFDSSPAAVTPIDIARFIMYGFEEQHQQVILAKLGCGDMKMLQVVLRVRGDVA